MESDERQALNEAIAAVAALPEPQVAEQKFCKDCKWVQGGYLEYRTANCNAPQAPASPVSGKKYEIACELMRSVQSSLPGFPACTVNGHWFVAKEGGT